MGLSHGNKTDDANNRVMMMHRVARWCTPTMAPTKFSRLDIHSVQVTNYIAPPRVTDILHILPHLTTSGHSVSVSLHIYV